MSGIVAIVAPAGETIDRPLVERMLEAQRQRCADGVRVWIDGPIALGFGRFAVTPEAAADEQPRANAAGTVRAVFDGRLDNREELIEGIRAEGRDVRSDADVDVLIAAYDVWGSDCAARLLGDFAFAIWDAPRRALVCARDILGGRPLYVHQRGEAVAVASEVAPLLKLPGIKREPNEGWIAECLTGQIVDRTDTVWRDISRIDAGHVVTFAKGRSAARRYWQPDPRREVRYRRDEEYGEHLAGLMREAIRPRLRASGAVAVMLSGGLDSSSIVGAVHEIHAAGAADGLRAYSMVGPGEEWDETAYIDAVAAKWPLRSRRLPAFRAAGRDLIATAVSVQDLPPYPNGEMANTLFEAVRADGVRVLLTGSWGDSWLSGSYEQLADLARRFQFAALWRQIRAQPDRLDIVRPRSMFRSVLWPLVPRGVRNVVKRAIGRDGIPPWVTKRLAASTGLAARLRAAPPAPAFPTLAQGDIYRMAFSGITAHAADAHERAASLFGLDTRHPFGDRRILEFGLAIPEDQRWRGDLPKFVLRTAARGWLPDVIRRRTTYGGASCVVSDTVRGLVAAGLWQNSVMERRGWVDVGALFTAFNQMASRQDAGDERYDDFANRLWLVCAVELWARHVLEEKPHG